MRDNDELMWSEGYYRGYYELHVGKDEVRAEYYGTSGILYDGSLTTA